MPIECATGNIFDARTDAIVNPVNCVGVMGKGLALEFKKRFPISSKGYTEACARNIVKIGELFVLTPTRDPWWRENGQYVIHFPTKKHWRDPSKLEYIEAGVKEFGRVFESLKIKSVAIPALGCGCGGLDWAVVKPVIVEGLRSVKGSIKVMLFEPELQRQQSCREH